LERDNESVIVFEDEASLSNTATISYLWAEKGRQPSLKQKQRQRERKTLFGCVEPKTGIVLTCENEKGNTKTFFSFLLKTVKHYGNSKVIMVLDNVKYHHAKRLKPILEKYKHRIELVYLPAYSPDLNPMERIWWYMRKKITHNRFMESMENRIEAFRNLMNQFQVENELGKSLCNLFENI
jgi:putative transposase